MLAPTLLVGLGGTGSDIVERVAKKASEEQRNRIGFVVFDTDVNELGEVRKKNPFIKTVQTSTKLTVGEYLNIDTHARDNWFPVNKILSRKTLTEGAGQVRAISRLALDTAIRAGNMEPLHKAIEDLYKLDGSEMQQALRVIVVSSLAGGTGSGLILPVSMYIKNYLATRFQQSANIMRGFFILPEVFYEVIHGQAERNNLKCNAYATIRELDAFLMKGDDSLPEKFSKNLKFEFPRVGSNECENYDVMPFDFCFLFDAQNVDGKKLNSFDQYKDHAASCIFAQSIGPMNKRSNSSEDNTIREICKSGGRNRYCGAGSSMLVYPFKDIKEYIALQWAKQCVSNQWLVFDKQYKAKCIANSEQRSKGYSVRDVDPAKDYVASVSASCTQKNPFGLHIVNSCALFDNDGLNRIGDKWTEYVSNLNAFITATSSEGQLDLDHAREEASGDINRLGQDGNKDWSPFLDAYSDLSRYKGMVFKRSEETARSIAYSMFKADNDGITSEKLKHQLETYLRDESGDFIHPNAARYFLYQTLDCLKAQKQQTANDLREYIDFFDTFERTAFDNPKTDEHETVDDIVNKKVSLADKFKRGLTVDQEELKMKYKKYLETVDEYRVRAIYDEVLKEGIEYVTSLCEAFSTFFNSFEGSVSTIDRNLSTISTKYQDTVGNTTRYVCSSENCFKKLYNRMPFMGSAINLKSDLCEKIYCQVRKYSMLSDKPNNDTFFVELFNNDILGYFRDSVMGSYGSQIDIDIIQALELEAELEHDTFDRNYIHTYVTDAIKESRTLSAPFIEAPLGEEKSPIDACAYNPSLDIKDNPARHNLVKTELANGGGVADDDIDKNMILFYKSIYGLRAQDLSKFAPPCKTEIAPHEAGEYYKAYFELINQIKPKSQDTPVITPHIDRNWHLISELPDLDLGNQKKQENEIYKALFYGLVFNKIQYKYISEKKTWYKLVLSGSSAEDFVVSNRTPCDTFYEVLDALTINPIVVRQIINAVEKDFEKERLNNHKVRFENCLLKTQLEKFKLVEFDPARRMSLFDIATILKVSTPADDFYNDQGYGIISEILDLVYDYLKKICPDDELNNMYGDYIFDQYTIFKENLAWYNKEWPNNFGDFIDGILELAISKLEAIESDDNAQIIADDIEAINTAKVEASRKRKEENDKKRAERVKH